MMNTKVNLAGVEPVSYTHLDVYNRKSLDHQLKYKKDLEDEDAAEIGQELRNCAEIIAETDWKMLEVRQRIEEKGIIVQR